MSIHEECGVFGVMAGQPEDVAGIVYSGLYALQHEIAGIIGADTLGYLPVEELCALAGKNVYCHACFTGKYPTAIPADTRKDRFERRLSE